MRYCPKCGASIGAARISRERYEKHEKQEKQEKHEKHEKQEKYEKEEGSRSWALLGGFILIVFGLVSIVTTYGVPSLSRGGIFLVLVGIVIMVIAVYGATRAAMTNPKP